MDYEKIYNNFLYYFINSVPKDRLYKRNKNDVRLKEDFLYVEKHHIIPKFMNGDNNIENLVELLPEEHLFIHKLRYKVFGYREDMLSVRFILNGMKSNKRFNVENSNFHLTKSILNGYAWIKTNTYNFKKEHGWHTEDGLKRISESRKNKIVVKDYTTNEIIGSVDKNHPNVLNGTWVHHSKNKKLSEKQIKYLKENNKGLSNPRSTGITDDEIIENVLKITKFLGYIPSLPVAKETGKLINLYLPINIMDFRFEGKGYSYVIERIEKITNLKYDPYYTRRNRNLYPLKKKNKKCWIKKDNISLLINLEEFEIYKEKGWEKGRIINGKSN